MKLAIVHDYLNQYGGAERVLVAVHKIWPEAPIFTSLIDREKLENQGFPFDGMDIKTSFMQKLPGKRKFANSYFLPFYPLAFESFDLNGYDVVLSITSFAAKGIITKPETLHISYCCTPTRHLWFQDEYISKHATIKRRHKLFLYPLLSYLRLWDLTASSRVDEYIAISKIVKERIRSIYHRDSSVIYPPVSLERFLNIAPVPGSSKNGYFLIVSRLGGHKRVDLAIDAFNQNGLPLKVIGEGPKLKEYRQRAGENIEFLGRLGDDEVNKYYAGCKTFIYPQDEDFGITALEAQAAGKPVIAYNSGGARETVLDLKTGVLFDEQTPESLIEAIGKLEKLEISEKDCRKQAEKFGEKRFREVLQNAVDTLYARYQKKR